MKRGAGKELPLWPIVDTSGEPVAMESAPPADWITDLLLPRAARTIWRAHRPQTIGHGAISAELRAEQAELRAD